MTIECVKYFDLKKFFEFVQQLMTNELILINDVNRRSEKSFFLIDDDVACSVDCLFYRQYQFFCRHL